MPFRTFLIAASSAATGALATALILNSRKTQTPISIPSQKPITSSTSSTITTATISQLPLPSQKLSEPTTPPVDPTGILSYGFPGPTSDLATRSAFISSFDRRTRNPHWVAEHITPQSLLLKNADRKNSQFLEDPLIPTQFRALLTDYFKSGYDRGHQAPAANAKWSQQAMDETFYLTNMCPQVGGGFNRDYWSHFEEFCRRLTKHYGSVRIITGPLYLPRLHPDGKWRVSYEVIGNPPNVAVPTHFYKVIIGEKDPNAAKSGEGPVAVGAFVLPNAVISNQTDLKEFEVPLEMVERASGLTFLEKLDSKRRKRLCGEVECSIVVRSFNDAKKEVSGGKK